MSSSLPGKSDAPISSAAKPTPFWRKPLVWIGALLLTALGASLTDVIKPLMTEIIERFTESGEPIDIHTEAMKTARAVSLPPGVQISPEDLARLEPLDVDKQAEWLESRGGVAVGSHSLTITITGNRSNPVRVTDIRDASECTEPNRGTLVRLGAPRFQIELSVQMVLSVGEADSHAMLWDPEAGTSEPYFPNRTITLKKDEQHVLVIQLYPPPGLLCRPQLELTVIHRDKEYKQQVVPEDQRPGVMGEEPAEVEQEYSQVFLGGYICSKYVRVTPGAETECGPEG